jgi:hypothetical protein
LSENKKNVIVIQCLSQFGNLNHYITLSCVSDALRVASRLAHQTGMEHRLLDAAGGIHLYGNCSLLPAFRAPSATHVGVFQRGRH